MAKRPEWDEAMLRLAQYEVRKFRNGKAIKEPISCIYEVFKYCGMDVMQTGRSSNRAVDEQCMPHASE